MNNDLAMGAEAVLFSEGEPLTRKKLSQLLECTPAELETALDDLSVALQQRGINLMLTDTEVALAVSPQSKDMVNKAYEHELGRELGDAGLEVVSILLYRGPSTRAHMDYIRGVNSTSTLRALLARGLIERMGNPSDSREYIYRPTLQLLAHLGVTHAHDLPEYATIAGELAAFEATLQADDPFTHGTTDEHGTNAEGEHP